MISDIRELTKAEEQIMQVLWKLKQAFVKDLIIKLPAPKPAKTTVSTIIRILEGKGFVAHEAFGSAFRYYPIISFETYQEFVSVKVLNNYFENSIKKLFSFFISKEKIDLNEANEILKLIENLKTAEHK